MTKAQLYSQIFIYILTIVVVALILVYGYRTIIGVKDKANQVMALKFEKELKSSVKSITGDFGSVVKKEIPVDEKTSQVCFVESYENFVRTSPIGDGQINRLIIESIRSSSDNNVFLMGDGLRSAFNAGSILIPNIPSQIDVLCIKAINGQIVFRLEGAGDHAIISRWT